MFQRPHLIIFFLVTGGWASTAFCSTLNREVLNVIDINPDPRVFEAELTATEQAVTIDGHPVSAMFYKDENAGPEIYSGVPNGIPVPQISVDVGDEVVVHFKNDLSAGCSAVACNSSIHWHGIELDNDSDGTGVTQNRVEPGESYTYRFIAPRPGVFWFHPHMLPGPQTFAGMYGAFIVRDPAEIELQSQGVIPGNASTHTLVLSDIEFDRDEPGNVGYMIGGDAVPWAVLKNQCADPSDPATQKIACQAVQDGLYPLVNGYYTGSRPVAPVLIARDGEGVRLRVINTATNRYFRLSLEGDGVDNAIYRIGGEGGFLEKVRLEGGVHDQWDTKYERGEIVIPASGRADLVIVPRREDPDRDYILTLVGRDYERGGPASVPDLAKPAGDLVYIVFNGDPGPVFEIAEGNAILGSGAIEDLKAVPDSELDELRDPPDKPDQSGPEAGTTNDTITLDVLVPGVMAINGSQGHFEDSGSDYKLVPYQEASRYAKTGDLLELTVKNCGNQAECGAGTQHHPFHLHGFSFQPVRVVDNLTGTTLYEYDYNEFQDVIDVFDGQSLVFRTRLEDRPIITDARQELDAPPPDQWFPAGGAQGRWVYHCHLFLHATLGMISELVVVPQPIAVCRDISVDTTPGACTAFDVAIEDGSFSPSGESFHLSQHPINPYPVGETLATLTATGGNGLGSTCQATVTVVDNEPPTISAPAAVVAECNTIGGRDDVELGTPTTTDNCSSLSTTPFGPDFYSLGENVVKWRVSDGSGNTDQDDQLVTIVDTKKPSLSVPDDIGPIECTSPTGETVDIGQATATDVCDDDVAISNNAPTVFTVGDTSVNWSAVDDLGNRNSGIQVVSIADTIPPLIACNAAELIIPSIVVQSFVATATDTCDTDVTPKVVDYDCYSFTKNGKRIDRTGTCQIEIDGARIDILDTGGVGATIKWTVVTGDDSGNEVSKDCYTQVVKKQDL